MTWEKLSDNFVESDVVEWVETIWPPQHSYKRRKRKPWGKQKVTAQITTIEGDFIKLHVLKAEIVDNLIGSELRPHKIGTTITKKRQSLSRGDAHRLHWSEENVRIAIVNAHSQQSLQDQDLLS